MHVFHEAAIGSTKSTKLVQTRSISDKQRPDWKSLEGGTNQPQDTRRIFGLLILPFYFILNDEMTAIEIKSAKGTVKSACVALNSALNGKKAIIKSCEKANPTGGCCAIR